MGLWECGQSRPRTRNPNANANKDCPPLSMLSAPPRTKNSRATRKDQKTGMPSEFSIGSGRIGPGAASKMRNPHEPSATRSRRDSTRLLTTARHSCFVAMDPCSAGSESSGASMRKNRGRIQLDLSAGRKFLAPIHARIDGQHVRGRAQSA